jgi:hypothetical protein
LREDALGERPPVLAARWRRGFLQLRVRAEVEKRLVMLVCWGLEGLVEEELCASVERVLVVAIVGVFETSVG